MSKPLVIKKVNSNKTYASNAFDAVSMLNEMQNKQSVVMLPIDQLDDYPDNERVFGIDKEEILLMSEDIKQNGFRGAIWVSKKPDGRYVILSGHQRVRAMLLNGEKNVPAFVFEGLTPEVEYDAWLKSNTRVRKSTPYSTYVLIQNIHNHIKQRREEGDTNYKGDINVITSKMSGISLSQVKRYISYETLPPFCIECMKDPSFPYTVLNKVVGFSEDKQLLFEQSLKNYALKIKEQQKGFDAKEVNRIVNETERANTGYSSNNGDEENALSTNADNHRAQYIKAVRILEEKAKEYSDGHNHKDDTITTNVIDDWFEQKALEINYEFENNQYLINNPERVAAIIDMLQNDLKALRKKFPDADPKFLKK